MKFVILAGGLGTRLSEETVLRPKPMVEIGNHPILWHIMKCAAAQGCDDFILLCGYKAEQIKRYFVDYYLNNSDITVDLKDNTVSVHTQCREPWKVTILDTGLETLTGTRLLKAKEHILAGGNEPFIVTYGDGLSTVNLKDLLAFHQQSGKAVTITAVQPTGRFGALQFDSADNITSFYEKPAGDGNWVNGGFIACEPRFFDFIPEGNVMLEREPFSALVKANELNAYRHHGFWQPMDTMRDKTFLEGLWQSGQAPWKTWD